VNSAEDVGKVVRQIFLDFDSHRDKNVIMAVELLTLQQMCDVLNKHLPGVTFIDGKVRNISLSNTSWTVLLIIENVLFYFCF